MANLPPWMLWAAIAFVLLAIGLGVYGAMSGGDEDEEGEEGEEGADGYDGGKTLLDDAARTQPLEGQTDEMRARKSRMIKLKESFESSLQTRAGPKQSARDRLSLPWFMLVGAEGSGKKSLLANTGLALPYGPPFEVDASKRDAGRWWLFDEAVVLEAPPATTAAVQPNDVGAMDSTLTDPEMHLKLAGWNNLLGLLRRERPDSPLNGIIVTVSCADLVGSRRKTPEEVGAQAERIRAFLDRTKQALGVRLPIHLLVTKCDVMPGFKSFAKCVPEKRRNDMFGWVNPHRLESSFQVAWIEDGFRALKREVADLHDELLASAQDLNTHDADGLFVFTSEFGEIQESLRDFVSRLMPVNEKRPSLFFRGIYFTGDTLDHASALLAKTEQINAGQTMKLSAEVALGDKGEARNLVFLRSLFAEKIFKEAGLARPLARFTLSRDRRVIALQAAILVFAVVGLTGLWTSVRGLGRTRFAQNGLNANATTLTQTLGGVAIDLDDIRRAGATGDTGVDARARDAAMLEMVGALRDVSPIRIRSAFLPTSWFSPLPAKIHNAMLTGMQGYVLPVARHRLQERTDHLLSASVDPNSLNAGADTLDAGDPRALTAYLADVRALSGQITRYNALASPNSGSVADLSAVLDYLYAARPLADTTKLTPEFASLLHTAASQKIAVKPEVVRAVLQRCVALISAAGDSATAHLALGSRVTDPAADISALRRLNDLVQLGDPKRGILGSVSDSAILGVRLARAIQDSVAAELQLVATRVARDPFAPDRGPKLAAAVTALFNLPFMGRDQQRQIEGELKPGTRMLWDIGNLALAIDLHLERAPAMLIVADAFPTQARDRLSKAFEAQIRARTIDVAAASERFVPADSADPSTEIQRLNQNIDVASNAMLKLTGILDSMNAKTEATKLAQIGARQAEKILALSQTIFDRQQPLMPQTIRMAAWQGVIPISYAAFGATDSIGFKQSYQQQVNGLSALAANNESALRFLDQPPIKAQIHEPHLVEFWTDMGATLAKAEQRDATSSFFVLDRFIRQTMSATDAVVCQANLAKRDTAKVPLDFFVRRKNVFHAATVGRCSGAADAVKEYQQIRSVFLTRLAGKFPFVDSAGVVGTQDADPAAVRDFFRLYDAFMSSGESALLADPRLGATQRPAVVFLEGLRDARSFFATFVDSGVARKEPEFGVVIPPRAAADGDRVLKIGDRSVIIDDAPHGEKWRFGEPVKLMKLADDGSAGEAVTDARGGWSLLRFARMQLAKNPVPVQFYDPETNLRLALPRFPADAPDIVSKAK